MAEGMSFSFPSLLFHEGRTYGQPEVVPISLPQVSTGLRSRLPGSFRRRGFQPDHRLCQIGGAVESVLGAPIEEKDIPKLIVFLKRQEANGRFFSKAMQKETNTDMEEV